MGVVHMWYPDYDFAVFLDLGHPQTQLVLALLIIASLGLFIKMKCQVKKSSHRDSTLFTNWFIYQKKKKRG